MITVRWHQRALDELTELWLAADSPQRDRITRAVSAIDKELLDNPAQKGESRPSGRRIFFWPPLGVTFRYDPALATVVVTHVWSFKPRR